jgi:hypothetical protein
VTFKQYMARILLLHDGASIRGADGSILAAEAVQLSSAGMSIGEGWRISWDMCY